jgi:hypothetical protein
MIRKLVLGFAASAALGLGLLGAAAPASAQSWSVTIGSGHGGYHHGGHHPVGDFYRPVGPGWGKGDGWGHHGGWGRPLPPYAGGGHGFHPGGPRCFVRKVRYWDGWGWAVERRRVCH